MANRDIGDLTAMCDDVAYRAGDYLGIKARFWTPWYDHPEYGGEIPDNQRISNGWNIYPMPGGDDSWYLTLSNMTLEIEYDDKYDPQATASVSNVTTPGAATKQFTVTYTDNVKVVVATLDNSDIMVTGPGGGYSPLATFVSVDTPGNGTPRTATYQITAPGGTWDSADNGWYYVWMRAYQVNDTSANFVPSGLLEDFEVNITDTTVPSLSINDVTLDEGNSDSTTFSFTVSMSGSNPSGANVSYATANETATSGSDYASSSGTLTWAAGDTAAKTVNVTVYGDTTVESDETFYVNLSSPSGATISDSQGVGTIQNDDASTGAQLDGFETGDFSALPWQHAATGGSYFYWTVVSNEKHEGTYSAKSGPIGESAASRITLTRTTSAGTISFWRKVSSEPVTDSLRFEVDGVEQGRWGGEIPWGQVSYPVSAGQRTFSWVYAKEVGGVAGSDTAWLDDIRFEDSQPVPSISISDVTLDEGNSDSTTFSFTVSMSGSNVSGASVNYTTADNTATTANGDYLATSGTLAWAAGDTSAKTVTVTVNGDTTVEPNETFYVNLSGASGATITDNQGVGTIQNDDVVLPALSINDVTLTEGNSGTTAFSFTVSLSGSNPSGASVNYTTADNTATTANGDYVATSGTLTWAAGDTAAKTVSVTVNGDTTAETEETFYVNLSSASGATISDSQGLGTIQNDDASTGAQLDGFETGDFTALPWQHAATGGLYYYWTVVSNEKQAGSYSAKSGPIDESSASRITLTRTTSAGTISFWRKVSSDAATDNLRFEVDGVEQGRWGGEIPWGQVSYAVSAAQHTFSWVYTKEGGVAAGSDAAWLDDIRFEDSQPVPSLSIDDVTLMEGNSGTTAFNFTVSLSASSSQAVTVNYATADGTATTADSDYQSNSGTLTFSPGQTSKTVTVYVNGDTKVESDEYFYVNLTKHSQISWWILISKRGRGSL